MKSAAMTDEDFLALLQIERRESIGFDNDDELADNREKALEYRKGEMSDLKTLPNRSKVVSTDIADAIETVKPDLMDVLAGGDDPVAFRPLSEEDEEAAQQETDYVSHVLFNENDGWSILNAHIDDALTCKLGIFKVWVESYEKVEEQQYQGQTELAVIATEQDGAEIVDLQPSADMAPEGEPLFDFTAKRTIPRNRVKVDTVAPEDFTFSRDAVRICDATYAAMRTRPRSQDLIADGYDPDLVAELSPYGSTGNDGMEQARDTAGEHDDGAIHSSSLYNLHQVEVVEHYIRVDSDGDGKPELWCVVTGSDERVLLKREKVNRIPFAVSTPFPVAHRLIGFSLADKLFEIQRIKTVLWRMLLDSGYFALNQRFEVAEQGASADTIQDLLNNVPGAPIRSKSGTAVRALGGAGVTFDVPGAIEAVAVMAEQRTGVVRNAQGLNPDTLHDTAKGMERLYSAAQKRTRMIARVFAETGVKALYLLIHDIAREAGSMAEKVRLRGKWQDLDPSAFSSRSDLTVKVGVGAGGREMELAGLQLIAQTQEKLVQLQGGPSGPFIQPKNLHATAVAMAERLGIGSPDSYFADPENAPPPGPPPPDPDMIKVQTDAELKRYQIEQETQLKREQLAAEMTLKREQMAMEMALRQSVVGGPGIPSIGNVRLGGDPG